MNPRSSILLLGCSVVLLLTLASQVCFVLFVLQWVPYATLMVGTIASMVSPFHCRLCFTALVIVSTKKKYCCSTITSTFFRTVFDQFGGWLFILQLDFRRACSQERFPLSSEATAEHERHSHSAIDEK